MELVDCAYLAVLPLRNQNPATAPGFLLPVFRPLAASSQPADVPQCGPVFVSTGRPREGVWIMKMPEKNPDLWAAIAAWLSLHAPSIYAFGLSVTVAAFRVIYGGGSRRQMALEGVMCGLATLTVVPLLQWLGLPQSMATFVGGLVGFIGVEKLRDIAIRWSERRVGL